MAHGLLGLVDERKTSSNPLKETSKTKTKTKTSTRAWQSYDKKHTSKVEKNDNWTKSVFLKDLIFWDSSTYPDGLLTM